MKTPTIEQYKAFGEYVCNAHSWYKHLPVFGGSRFYFILNENAGAGYTDEKPRMHYGWQTTQEYQERFGAIDYLYELNGSIYADSDDLEKAQLSKNVLSKNIHQNSILLTAYVSPEQYREIVALRTKELCSVIPQPYKNWFIACDQSDELWEQLTDGEVEFAIQEPLPDNPPKQILECLAAEENERQIYRSLMEQERRKVFSALEKLRIMELENEAIWFE